METYLWGSGAESPCADAGTGLEDSFRKMQLGVWDAAAAAAVAYPERPGEQDCLFYMRTGACGYGERCRFNHPRDRSVGAGALGSVAEEYPERPDQPVCQYFLNTGSCKFGPLCKYHHPSQGDGSMRPVLLNCCGYPIRPGEKECSYYARTGQCKFGQTCKFHHPRPFGFSESSQAPVVYPTFPSQYATPANWAVPRYIPVPYGPMMVPSGVVTAPDWSSYQPPAGAVLSPGAQQTVQSGEVYGKQSSSASAYVGSYPPSPGASSAAPSSSRLQEAIFPARPGQPECQYYIRTGNCKFGSMCRYHHPQGWNVSQTNCLFTSAGLPLRPGAPPCSYYTQHGVCKFGPTCRFDHPMVPMGLLNYSPSASSLVDMPIAPYPSGGVLVATSSSVIALLLGDKARVCLPSIPNASIFRKPLHDKSSLNRGM